MPHYSPCGAIVGRLRSCYRAPCRWYPGGPVGIIEYYFVPPTNAYLPDGHVFQPLSQQVPFRSAPADVGELTTARRQWTAGRTTADPIPDGSHPCGTPADFAGLGASPRGPRGYILEADLPACDWPQALPVDGVGLVGGGTAFRVRTRPTDGRLGLLFGPPLVPSRPPAPPTGVGLLGGGSADAQVGPRAPRGVGLLGGGTAPRVRSRETDGRLGLLWWGPVDIERPTHELDGVGLLGGGTASGQVGPRAPTGVGLVGGGGLGTYPPLQPTGEGLLGGGKVAGQPGLLRTTGRGLLGGGSAQATSGGTVYNACCDTPWPLTLTGTVTGGFAEGAAIPAELHFEWNGFGWPAYFTADVGEGPREYVIELYCDTFAPFPYMHWLCTLPGFIDIAPPLDCATHHVGPMTFYFLDMNASFIIEIS